MLHSDKNVAIIVLLIVFRIRLFKKLLLLLFVLYLQKARKTGEKGHYFLDNFVKVVGKQPIFANRSSGAKLLKLLYRHNYTRVIEVHVKADHITVLKSG